MPKSTKKLLESESDVSRVSKYLIGAKVLEFKNDEWNSLIHLKVQKDGRVYGIVAWPYAECCSSSWIESVSDSELLVGSTILKFSEEESNYLDSKEFDTYSCIDYRKYQITCTNGYVDIEFRNESNGYYTGYLEFDVIEYVDVSGLD